MARSTLVPFVALLSLAGCNRDLALPPPPAGGEAVDVTPPSFTGFVATPAQVRAGAQVRLTFELSEPLAPSTPEAPNPLVTFGTAAMSCSASGLTLACVAVAAAEQGEGETGFSVSGVDVAGNASEPISPPVSVLLDFTPPVLAMTAAPDPVKAGMPVTFAVSAGEPLEAPPTIAAAFLLESVACVGAGTAFTCPGGVVDPASPGGPAAFSATGSDLAGNVATGAGSVVLELPVPVITLDALTPDPARADDPLRIDFSAPQPLEGCAASVSGLAAACAPPSAGVGACSCTLRIPGALPDGLAIVDVEGTNAGGRGVAQGALQVDQTPPVLDPALIRFERHGIGTADAVRADPTAAADLGGTAYPGRSAVAIRIWDAGAGGTSLLTLTRSAAGSFPVEPIPGTESLGVQQLFASPVDLAGNEGTRVAISGADLDAPVANGARLAIERRAIGLVDGLRADPGAFADASALATVELFDASVDGTSLGSFPFAADGSLAEIPLGTASSTLEQLWVAATDKCGITGPRFEVIAGRDVTAPAIDRFAVTLHERRPGTSDAVFASAGAFTDPPASQFKELRFYADAGGGSPLLGGLVPDGAGALPEVPLGDTALRLVFVEAEDKAGHVSPRVPVGLRRSELTLAGRTPYSGAITPMAIFPYVAERDPRTVGPGVGPATAPEAPALDSAAAAAIDADRAVIVAAPETALAPLDWTLAAAVPSPPPVPSRAMVYDAARGRLVLFGETWEHDGLGWAQVFPVPAPPARDYHAMAYDAGRGRSVLFGGGADLADLWEYDGVRWTERFPPAVPSGRHYHALAHDVVRGRTLLFGGFNGTSQELSDGWQYAGTTWAPVAAGPPRRARHAMAYDAARDRVVLFGGQNPGLLADTWEFDGTSWTQAFPASAPSARWSHAMAFDAARGTVVLFGGEDAGGRRSDAWEYDGVDWRPLSTATVPPARRWPGLAFDGARGQLVLFGGDDGAGNLDDTWLLADRTPHARTAAQVVLCPLEPLLPLESLAVTYVGAGSGDSGGAAADGVELLIWSGAAGAWVSLGSHGAQDADPAAARTITATPPGAPSDYAVAGRVWLLAVPLHPSSDPPGSIDSELATDYVELAVAYRLP